MDDEHHTFSLTQDWGVIPGVLNGEKFGTADHESWEPGSLYGNFIELIFARIQGRSRIDWTRRTMQLLWCGRAYLPPAVSFQFPAYLWKGIDCARARAQQSEKLPLSCNGATVISLYEELTNCDNLLRRRAWFDHLPSRKPTRVCWLCSDQQADFICNVRYSCYSVKTLSGQNHHWRNSRREKREQQYKGNSISPLTGSCNTMAK